MKHKSLFLAAVFLSAIFMVSCKKEEVKPEVKSLTFDYKELVKDLNTPYKDFAKKYAENISIRDDYAALIVLKGVCTVEGKDYSLNIIASGDTRGNISKIVTQPMNEDNSKVLWNHFVGNSSQLGYGAFIEAKYKTLDGSGTLTSQEEAMSFFGSHSATSSTFLTSFAYAGGNVRLALLLSTGNFAFLIMDNYLTLDESVLRGWPGVTYTDLVTAMFVLSKERDKSLFFERAEDLLGNRFTVEAFNNEKNGKVKTVDAVLDETVCSTWDKVLSVWKSYAKGEGKLNLGTLKTVKVYKDGKEVSGAFTTVDEMLADLEKKGRPSDAIYEVTFAKDVFYIAITLDAETLKVQGFISE